MEEYPLGVEGIQDAVGTVPPGTNIILIGPPMSGKEIIAYNILYRGLVEGEGGILVTTGLSGEDVLRTLERNGFEIYPHVDRLGIVDCVSQSIGLKVGDTETIRRVSSPVNLTGVSVGVTSLMEELWRKKGVKKVRLVVNSLSTMLMYSNLQTVFRFLHVFVGRIKSAGALGIYMIEEGMHDEQTIVTLKQLVDGAIEIKSQEDAFFMRCVGVTPRPTKWYQYEIEGAKINIKYSYLRPGPE